MGLSCDGTCKQCIIIVVSSQAQKISGKKKEAKGK